MSAKYEIKNHFLFVDGKQVPYKASPNVGGACKPEILVMHDTASGLTPDGDIAWLTNPAAKASAHFVIARDGGITQLVPLNKTAWHAGKSSYNGRNVAGSVNSFSIGIEIDNPGIMTIVKNGKAFYGDGKGASWDIEQYGIKKAAPLPLSLKRAEAYWMPHTKEQLEVVRGIGQAIKDTYDIKDVVAHWTVSPGRKVDTNPLFPLEEMKEAILKGTDDMAKSKNTSATPAKTEAKKPTTVAKKPATADAASKTVTKKETKAGELTKIKDGDSSTTIVNPNTDGKAATDTKDSVEEQFGMRAPIVNEDTLINETRERLAKQEEDARAAIEEQRIKDEKARAEEIEASTGVVKKADQEEATGTGLVKMNLNLRAWPDSPNIIAVLNLGATVEVIRETESQVTRSKWYKVRADFGDIQNGGKKGSTYTGFVHGSYLDVNMVPPGK